MLTLDDCGRELNLRFDGLCMGTSKTFNTDVKVQMVIKAPKGTLVLFDNNYIIPHTQLEAIKSFMEEHRDD